MSEIAVVGVVALVVVGPQRLPGMLRTMGEYVGKLRRMVTQVRAQTGIDDILREEGIDGVKELRSLLRGEMAHAQAQARPGAYDSNAKPDLRDEYPVEGADAGDALPEDLAS
jgi:sec-independent protein translocase protein TatB